MASTTEDIIVRYRVEVDQLTKELDGIILKQAEIVKGEKAVGTEAKKSQTSQQFAAQKRKELIKAEEAELRKLAQLLKLAFDPKQIEEYNRRIAQSKGNISTLRGQVSGFGKTVGSIFAGIGAGIAASFSIRAVIQFGKAAVNAFLDAQAVSEKLKFAIVAIGGEGEASFQRLIDQSKRLQQVTRFNDDSIQAAQASLSAFGLSAAEIEEVIPVLADFATITGSDIPSAVQELAGGLEGMGRTLKKYGVQVDASSSRTENLRSIMEGLAKFSGAATDAAKTLTGELAINQNQADELAETVGERLAPAFVKFKKAAFQGVINLLDDLKRLGGGDFSQIFFRDEPVKTFEAALDDVTKKIKVLEQEKIKARKAQEDEDKKTKFVSTTTEALRPQEQPKDAAQKAIEAIELTQQANKQAFEANKKARAEAIEQIRLELLANVELRNEALKQALLADNLSEDLLKGYALRLEEARKELAAIRQIINSQKESDTLAAEQLKEIAARELKAIDLKKLNVEDLNRLLKANTDLEDSASKANVKLINAELEARKKADDELTKLREKAAAELKANQERLLELQIQNIEDLKQQRIAEFEKETNELTAKGELRNKIIKELEKQLIKDLNKIDEQRNVDPLFKVPVNEPTIPTTLSDAAPIADFTGDIDAIEEAAALFEQQKADIQEQATSLVHSLIELYANYTNTRIEQIEREKNAQLEALDLQQESINSNLKKRRISETEAERLTEDLARKKAQIEKQAADKERALKRKAAMLDKANALIQITINTAQGASKAYAQGGVLGPALAALIIAAGVAQAAIVASQPIPYKRGSKNTGAKGHLARVGEQGEETVFMPARSKVLPARQTKEYSKVIDAMFDNRLEDYVLKQYVMPALVAQKKSNEKQKDESFSRNVANSIRINVAAPPGKKLERVHVENMRELVVGITNGLKQDPYR